MSNVRTCKGCNFDFFHNSNFDSAAGMCVPCSRRAKCPVFGCTIPRGIPHEHPAGVSAVMRDPVAPLNATERAELESFRREALLREYANEQLARNKHREALYAQAMAMQNTYPFGLGQNTQANAEEQRLRNYRNNALFDIAAVTPSVYVIPADSKIFGGRKLTQALLEAGHNTYEQNKAKAEIVCNDLAVKVLTEMHERASIDLRQRHDWNGIKMCIDEPEPRRSLVSTTARVAFWIVLAATVAIGIFAGVKS